MKNITFFSLALIFTLAVTAIPAQENKPAFGEVNMGTGDRIVRLVVGLGLAGAGGYFAFAEEESWGYIPLGISAIPFLTAATGICPLYYPFGIDTRGKSKVSVIISPEKVAGLQYSYTF